MGVGVRRSWTRLAALRRYKGPLHLTTLPFLPFSAGDDPCGPASTAWHMQVAVSHHGVQKPLGHAGCLNRSRLMRPSDIQPRTARIYTCLAAPKMPIVYSRAIHVSQRGACMRPTLQALLFHRSFAPTESATPLIGPCHWRG